MSENSSSRRTIIITVSVIAAVLVLSWIGSLLPKPLSTPHASSSARASIRPTPVASASATPTPTPTPTPTGPANGGVIDETGAGFTAMLEQLPVDDAVHDGYERDLFKHWTDADHDGCDTRAEVLMLEALSAVTHGSTCAVKEGSWWSSYDNLTYTIASQLDVDHMVPLAEAWRSGAYAWSASRREAYANDLGYEYSLVAVSASSNRSKSDQDPAQWMPRFTDIACSYAAEWVGVKFRWTLSVDSAERGALTRILNGCGSIAVTLPTPAPSN